MGAHAAQIVRPVGSQVGIVRAMRSWTGPCCRSLGPHCLAEHSAREASLSEYGRDTSLRVHGVWTETLPMPPAIVGLTVSGR